MCEHKKPPEDHTNRELTLEMYKILLQHTVEHEQSRNNVAQAVILARVAFLAVFGTTLARLFGFNLPDLTS